MLAHVTIKNPELMSEPAKFVNAALNLLTLHMPLPYPLNARVEFAITEEIQQPNFRALLILLPFDPVDVPPKITFLGKENSVILEETIQDMERKHQEENPLSYAANISFVVAVRIDPDDSESLTIFTGKTDDIIAYGKYINLVYDASVHTVEEGGAS